MQIRPRLGNLRPRLDVPNPKRSARIHELARALMKAGKGEEGLPLLRDAAAGKPDAEEWIQKLIDGKIRAKSAAGVTVRALGERWTSGALAREYPDQIKAKRSARDDIFRLEKYVYPVIGDHLVSHVTLDDCEAVMRAIPAEREAMTRRNIGQTLARLLKIAVYPLRLRGSTPIPAGFLPRGPTKGKQVLYPDEAAVVELSPRNPRRPRHDSNV